MTIRRFADARKIMLRINPVEGSALDFGASRVAALVLLSEPAGQPPLDTVLVADVLNLTAAESQVAVLLAEGVTVPDIAMSTGPPDRHCPHADSAGVPEARHFPSGGAGAAGIVAGGRVHAATLKKRQ